MNNRADKLFCGCCGIIALIVFNSCSTSKPMIRSDYDHDADFSAYRTFGFFDKLATDRGYETLVTRNLKQAVTQQMQERGIQYSHTDPDLLVNFKLKLEDKQQIRNTGYPGGYYGYRGRYYGAWGGYAYNTYTYEYTEGTLNIDVVDRRRKLLVWEGVAIGRVKQSDIDNQKQVISKVVASMFKEFPVERKLNTSSLVP